MFTQLCNTRKYIERRSGLHIMEVMAYSYYVPTQVLTADYMTLHEETYIIGLCAAKGSFSFFRIGTYLQLKNASIFRDLVGKCTNFSRVFQKLAKISVKF